MSIWPFKKKKSKLDQQQRHVEPCMPVQCEKDGCTMLGTAAICGHKFCQKHWLDFTFENGNEIALYYGEGSDIVRLLG